MTRSLPEDPLIRSLVIQARRHQMSRRAVLAGAGAGAAALTLAACAPEGSGKPTPAEDNSANDPTLTWANWALYLDEDDDGNHPTLEAFTEATGITVDYRVDIDDNNSFYAKVKDQLALGQHIGSDLVCLTDWMVSRWIRLGYTQTFTDANLPNARANLEPSLLNVDFDPGRTQSLPWQGGFAGICWNKEKVPNGLKSVSDLWDPSLKGRVGVLSEMRDTIGVIMLEQGVDISGDFTDDQFGAAIDLFREQVESGQIRNIKGNSYIDDLANEDTLAAIVWSGDVTTLNLENGDRWEFALPEAGGTIWNDNFMIPVGSPRKTNAEKLIDFYYDPEIAAEVAAWVNYITPVVGAKEAAEAIDPELVDNQLIFPNEETLSQVKRFRSLTPAQEQAYGAEFQSVLIGA
ncbi:polyamine ABC transporter substrate-binding protein [Protaetiibacter intestinalis]|uniref:Spermidine/putrescine ABC transporter substrate-binding protein n=1 Tax=Protaetiibacter intestinalis TaxID=2419774 RepID=A0A387BAV2_9MICO|nr:spermidine/putrescine ABC transporter substrate-binding protein [Protaetiibacter intestinalis]AYF98838.1 spermidine/putrescine ABC transporter substrate-binding protein [Protaetiibacter intestinalis]